MHTLNGWPCVGKYVGMVIDEGAINFDSLDCMVMSFGDFYITEEMLVESYRDGVIFVDQVNK